MVIAPSSYPLRKFPFVDREECKQIFQDFLETSEQKKYNVLHYYGISGIGKSKLQQELQSILTDEYPDVGWANVDFKVKTHREIGTFLFSLRSQLAGKYKVKFVHFDIAHAVYWKKVNPEIALAKEKYSPIEEGSTVDIMFKILNAFGPFNLLVDVPNYLLHAPAKFKRWWNEEGLRLATSLNESNPNQIEQLLPVLFFTDLQSHLKNKSKKATFFIDTYEALWEELRNTGNFNSRDEWIRNIIANFENVSWVICGREELRWNEVDNDWNNYLDQHKIGVLPREYCIEFLQLSSVNEQDIQNIIIEASEGYPYYLALSVDTYFAIKGRTPVPEDFPKTRPEIFNRFFHYLNAAERSTLSILSCANFWDHDLMNLLIDKFGTNYPKSKSAFEELHLFSFMEKRQNGTWDMHLLMKKSLRDNLEPEQKHEAHEYLFNHYDEQLEDIDIKYIQDFHKTAFTEAFYHEKQIAETEDLFLWFSKRSDIFDKAGFWDFLIPLYDDICNLLEKMLGSENPNVATCLNNLALLYYQMGNYEEALTLYERSLEIRKKMFGPEHLDVATSLNDLAVLYYTIGNYEEALTLYERSLEIRKKMLGPEHLDVATSYNNLAAFYLHRGKYEEALSLYKRAIKILEKTLGSEHRDVAASLSNLAVVYYSMGKYGEALPLYKRALEIQEKILGSEHPNVATCLNNLAILYDSMGKYEEALPLLKQALEICTKKLGPEHPDVATNLNILAYVYYHMGKYDEALPLYKRTLEIREKIFGPEHPDVANCFNNLAELHDSMDKYDEALILYRKALEIREKIFGPEHPDVATNQNNLALLYCTIGKYDEALILYKRALEIHENMLGSEHPEVATTLNNLAGLHDSMGKYDEALPLYKRALEIRENMLGSEHPEVAIILNNLATLYNSKGMYDKSLHLYERALSILEKTLGIEHPKYISTMDNLTSLLLQLEE